MSSDRSASGAVRRVWLMVAGAAWVVGGVAGGMAAVCPPSESESAVPADPPDHREGRPDEAQPTEARKPWLEHAAPDPDDPAMRTYAAQQARRVNAERELRKIRAKHFGGMRNTEIRQLGIAKLRGFTDPVVFPAMLEIFAREKEDVRLAVLDHFADLGTDEGDATLAWAAVFDRDDGFRAAARERLLRRTDEAGEVSNRVKAVVEQGLKRERDSEVVAAAELAGPLKLYEVIPALVSAQVRGTRTGGGGGNGDGALAFILVGQQQAFVADLTPVVGDSAVAFDPTLGVVTEGTVIRILGASVVTYRVEVHRALVRLADAGWDGRSTESLGWDGSAWRRWYAFEFKPYRKQVEAEEAAKRKLAAAGGGEGAGRPK